MRRYALLGLGLLLLVMGLGSAGVTQANGIPSNAQTQGMRGGWEVRVTDNGEIQLVNQTGVTKSVGHGENAQVDAAGNVYFGDWKQGLLVYDNATAEVRRLAQTYTVGPPFLLDPTGQQLIVHIKDDFVIDLDHATTIGVGVLDVKTGAIKPLLVKHRSYVLAFAWQPDGVFIQTFGHDTGHPVFEVLHWDGTQEPLPPNDLPYTEIFPKISPRQRHLVYAYDGAVGIIDMQVKSIRKIQGATAPRFQGDRLMLQVNGHAQEIILSK